MVALPIATAFIGWKFWHIAGQPLNESLYVPLLVVSTAAMIRLCDRSDDEERGLDRRPQRIRGHHAIDGAPRVGGRVAGGVARAARPGRHGRGMLALLIGSFVAVFSLVTIRNWIVAGVFAPTSTEMGITLLGGNEPPPGLTIDPGATRRSISGSASATSPPSVIEYAITEPRLFALNLGRKALFVLGFYEPYAPGWGYSPVYILTWTTAIAGAWLAVRKRQGLDVAGPDSGDRLADAVHRDRDRVSEGRAAGRAGAHRC